MGILLQHTVLLLFAAVLVALIARRLRLPYTVGLVVTGAALAFAHLSVDLPLTRDLVFDVILPPLLFEAAINLRWKELRRDMLLVLVLATFGVVISGVFVAWGMRRFAGWPWWPALIFGALIAATDPVAVIGMFKEVGLKGRLRLCVEAESLFNDGVAAVFMTLVLSAMDAPGSKPDAARVLWMLAFTVGGGLIVGAVCSGVAAAIAGGTQDHLVQTAPIVVVAYGSFFLAEKMAVSGVLATVTAGLLMGNSQLAGASGSIAERGRAFMFDFWAFIAFLAESLIFLLIGLRLGAISYSTLGMGALIVAILLTTAGRALAVYPLCLAFSRSRWAIPLRQQHVLWWGGLRGALGLALALSLPRTVAFSEKITIATFGVVAFSIVVQGLTMPLLLKKIGLMPPAEAR